MTHKGAVVLSGVSLAIGIWVGYQDGCRTSRADLPSCIYILRPPGSTVKPWGYDGKEGVDLPCDMIAGGGFFVDLSKWKKGTK